MNAPDQDRTCRGFIQCGPTSGGLAAAVGESAGGISPFTSFIRPRQHDLGLGSPAVPEWLIAPAAGMAWGVLPPARSVREPLMGTCGLIADS